MLKSLELHLNKALPNVIVLCSVATMVKKVDKKVNSIVISGDNEGEDDESDLGFDTRSISDISVTDDDDIVESTQKVNKYDIDTRVTVWHESGVQGIVDNAIRSQEFTFQETINYTQKEVPVVNKIRTEDMERKFHVSIFKNASRKAMYISGVAQEHVDAACEEIKRIMENINKRTIVTQFISMHVWAKFNFLKAMQCKEGDLNFASRFPHLKFTFGEEDHKISIRGTQPNVSQAIEDINQLINELKTYTEELNAKPQELEILKKQIEEDSDTVHVMFHKKGQNCKLQIVGK